jgi:small subunit ribosomal protein S12
VYTLKFGKVINTVPFKFLIRNIFKKPKKVRKPVFNRLRGASHRKAVIAKVVIITPKKPNSALRHVAKTSVYLTMRKAFARITGVGSVPSKFNRVLLRGGRANDLPSVRLTLVRNVYDFGAIYGKKKRRSVYGTPRSDSHTSHVRRRFRHLHS